MNKLTSKAKSFLKKYQTGGTEPLSMIPNVVQRNYQQSLIEQQKQDQLMLENLKRTSLSTQPTQTQQLVETGTDLFGMINPMAKVGIGIIQLINSQKQRKEARERQKMYNADLERRADESRVNDYYQTPYTTFQQGGVIQPAMDLFEQFYLQQTEMNERYSQDIQNYYDQLAEMYQARAQRTRKEAQTNIVEGATATLEALSKVVSLADGGMYARGGVISRYRDRMKSKKRNPYRDRKQEGGHIDTVMTSLYNLIETDEQRKEREFHLMEIERLKGEMNHFDQLRAINNQSFSMLIKDNNDKFKAKSKIKIQREKQDGGEITEVNPNLTDIYSEEFDPNAFRGQDPVQEVLNLEVNKAVQEADQEGALMDWILQDEEPNYSPIEAQYYEGQEQSTVSGSVVDQIAMNESGGDYSVVNPRGGATGKYQFMPMWSGQIRDFMGLPRETPKEQVMERFRNTPEAQDQFMNHVVENIYKPILNDIRPLGRKYGFSDDQLIRLLHYRGESDTRKRLRTGNFEVSQDEKERYNNPDILEYLRK